MVRYERRGSFYSNLPRSVRPRRQGWWNEDEIPALVPDQFYAGLSAGIRLVSVQSQTGGTLKAISLCSDMP